MSTMMQSLGIDRLPVDDRLDLIEEIWDSVASEIDKLPLTPDQEVEIARRLDEHEADPDDVIPWETIKAEAEARFEQ
jgi:putative addiction module component (TIGR02574 family)